MTDPDPFLLRDQRPDDAGAVAAVIAAAFADEPEVVGLEASLASRPDSRGYVAETDGEVVGHVRLTRGWIDAPDRLATVEVLGPLSVRPDLQRRGLGRALVGHALARADAAQTPMVLLEGDPTYYGRLGWRPAGDIGIAAPSERIPAAGCQVVTLTAYQPWMRGRLVYADTFWAHDCVGLRGDLLARFTEASG